MSRKQRGGKGRGPGAPGGQPQAAGARPAPQQQGQQASGGWGPVRDSVKRDIEQAAGALAFAERLHERLDTQRRLFLDFPRVMEQLRSGALERVAGPLARLFEGGQAIDLSRFLRDLPLALSHLAMAEAQARKSAASAGAAKTATAAAPADAAPAAAEAAPEAADAAPAGSAQADTAQADSAQADASAESAPPEASPEASPEAPAEAAPADVATAEAKPAEPAVPSAAPEAAAVEAAGPVSPRLELRSKLLVAAPQLSKAAQSYRRNVATVRRAASPRRSPGPWRSDREVLEEARRAIEFAQKLYDAYADAWADQPLTSGLMDAMSAEADRFLAWTQLNRYVELAVHGPSGAPRGTTTPPPPAHPPAQPVTEASPGAVVATSAEPSAEAAAEAAAPEQL